MRLDCVHAREVGLAKGWAIVDTETGRLIGHHVHADSGFAWMDAADALAKALTDIQLTIYNVGILQSNKSSGREP